MLLNCSRNKYLIICLFLFFSGFSIGQSAGGRDTELAQKHLSQTSIESSMNKIDTMFFQSDFEGLALALADLNEKCDTCVSNYLAYLAYITDTIIQITESEIQSSAFIVSAENIKLLDDLDFFLSDGPLNWNSFQLQISVLKCKFNDQLLTNFTSDIDKAYKFYKASSNLGFAGQIIAENQVLRLKFFRDSCFNKIQYDQSVKKIIEISNWIEKEVLDSKYKQIADNQPEWVKMGMTFEQYQEWWAQKLTVGSEYMGGGCTSCGKSLYRGKRGGIYYMNSNGNKQYVPRH